MVRIQAGSPRCTGSDQSKLCHKWGCGKHHVDFGNAPPSCFLCPDRDNNPKESEHVLGCTHCMPTNDELCLTKYDSCSSAQLTT